MDDEARQDVTLLLAAAAEGDSKAAGELLPLIYDELCKLARSRMARTPPGNTLQATALVHEAYLQLLDGGDPGWKSRGHFFGAAALAMRNILVDQARRKSRLKRGGDRQRVAADAELLAIEPPEEDVLKLDAALNELAMEDARCAEVVMLRYFSGLTEEQTAEVLGVSDRTVRRDWLFARAWLKRALDGQTETTKQRDSS